MKQNPLGLYSRLRVARFSEIGAWLENDSDGILLPSSEVPLGTKIDDFLSVFVYKDSKARLTATLQKPAFTLNECAALKIADVNQYGAFTDWGVPNQLLIPFREQYRRLNTGETAVVRLYVDTKTDRLVGSTYVEKELQPAPSDLETNEPLDTLVYEKTLKGYKVIVNQVWAGLIFHSDVHQQINIGDHLTGYLLRVREDGKLDIRLQAEGLSGIQSASERLIQSLKLHKGVLPIHDKSTPETILRQVGMSKKTFKRAAGMLLKEKKIEMNMQGIFLLKK